MHARNIPLLYLPDPDPIEWDCDPPVQHGRARQDKAQARVQRDRGATWHGRMKNTPYKRQTAHSENKSGSESALCFGAETARYQHGGEGRPFGNRALCAFGYSETSAAINPCRIKGIAAPFLILRPRQKPRAGLACAFPNGRESKINAAEGRGNEAEKIGK